MPFGSIFIEMYFVFTSFWNYKVAMPEVSYSRVQFLKLKSIILVSTVLIRIFYVSGILCVWVHVTGICNTHHRYRLCHYCGDIFSP